LDVEEVVMAAGVNFHFDFTHVGLLRGLHLLGGGPIFEELKQFQVLVL
jgi:hypothetical protein